MANVRYGSKADVLLKYALYNSAALQAYGLMFVWADTGVDRVVLGWEVPVTWIGVVDGLLTIAGVVLASRIWIRLAARGREPSDFAKLASGYAGIAAAFLLAAAIATLPLVPVLLWIGFFVILDFSFGWVEPPIQSLVSRDSPESVNATMMAVLKATSMFSYFFLGWLGRFYEPLGASLYWAAMAGLPITALFIMTVLRWPMMRLLDPKQEEQGTAVPL